MFDFMIMLPDGGGRTMLRSTALPVQALQDLWLIPARKEAAAADGTATAGKRADGPLIATGADVAGEAVPIVNGEAAGGRRSDGDQ